MKRLLLGWTLVETETVQATVRKARTRRGAAAFAKLTTAVLLEVGVHNPLAAAIGRDDESEWALAQRLVAQVPAKALVLGDRLDGCGAFAAGAMAACQRVGSHFLLRARSTVKPGVVERLPDGSRLILVTVYADAGSSRVVDWLRLREIRVRVGRRGHRAKDVRLWTTLLDPAQAGVNGLPFPFLPDARWFSLDPLALRRGGREERIPFDPIPHVHQPLIQTIVDELLGRGRCESMGRTGARASWALEQCVAGYYGSTKYEARSTK